MIRAKNYEKLSKFLTFSAKILSVLFYGHSVFVSKACVSANQRVFSVQF